MQRLEITDTPIRGYLVAFVLRGSASPHLYRHQKRIKITLRDMKIHATSQVLTISNYAKCNFQKHFAHYKFILVHNIPESLAAKLPAVFFFKVIKIYVSSVLLGFFIF